ncbi:MAG: DNA methyltransferase [Tissierellia bacterium]|nr:DNA methyltransferase [Tissierellia bacterium]
MKSSRNKTIDFGMKDADEYLSMAISADKFEGKFDNLINRNIVGDFFKAIELIEDESIDLAIVDPPYNLRKNYHGNIFNKKNNDEYIKYTQKWLDLIYGKLKKDGSIYICCDWESSIIIGQVLSEKMIVRNRITWQREKGRGSKTNWKNGMEDIWFATKSNKYKFNIDDVKIRKRVIAPYRENGKPKDWEKTDKGNFRNTHPSNFWDDITIPFWSMSENTAHPTQKPEKLIAKLILASSDENDLILDPFLGSGTTSVVAKKLNRRFIGIEQNPLYVAWAYKRLENAEYDLEIQGYEDKVFWERNSK